MVRKLINVYRKYKRAEEQKQAILKEQRIQQEYFDNGQIPWVNGYWTHKIKSITNKINNTEILDLFAQNKTPENYGYRIDERIVEYPWIFSHLPKNKSNLLDAGSTFNYDFVVNHPEIAKKELTIYTFAPEEINFIEKRISYVFGDLRNIPFRDGFYDIVVSQSTIEHIDMDNSMYGYDIGHNVDENKKSYDYLIAVKEMLRVLKVGGTLLITFPYGKFEHHSFFQQFDREMLERITLLLKDAGEFSTIFFRYTSNSWKNSLQNECDEEESYNPHTGKGKKDDFAAHSRAICCLKFIKK